MIVCICHRVSDRDIARAAAEGCASFDALQDELLVATHCGSCRECALDTFEAHRAQIGAGIAVGIAAGAVACGAVMPPARVPVRMIARPTHPQPA